MGGNADTNIVDPLKVAVVVRLNAYYKSMLEALPTFDDGTLRKVYFVELDHIPVKTELDVLREALSQHYLKAIAKLADSSAEEDYEEFLKIYSRHPPAELPTIFDQETADLFEAVKLNKAPPLPESLLQ